MLTHRLSHYVILVAVMAVTTLPNLGAHSFWDADEGVNAEAAREMLEAGTVLTPLFNFELRTAKPVLLYWLQMVSYSFFGINEFAARFPSVLAALVTVILVYELGRRMFGAGAGLLSGIILASALEFCMLAHAATPDSTLLMFTVLTLYLFWIGSIDGRRAWLIPCSAAMALAFMTKGPVGVVLPGAAIVLYLLWNGELRRLLDRRALYGVLVFILIGTPWYIFVTVETRGVWGREFFGKENLGRFSRPMENHQGPFFYHVVGIMLLFAPWSIFLIATIRNAIRAARANPEAGEAMDSRRAHRLLLCWIATYLAFFSIAATKLPNYVLPVYPALALLTARLLERWRTNAEPLARWVIPTGLACLAATGLIVGTGLAIAGGVVPLPGVSWRSLPNLGNWLWVGLVPIFGAAAGTYYLVWNQRNRLVGALAVTSVSFIALLAAFPINALDEYKAARRLVVEAGIKQTGRDIRVLSLQWFQPSVVFYSQREVERLKTWPEAEGFLAMRHPVYLFVPEPVWQTIQAQNPQANSYRTVARHYDFVKSCDIVVVTNQ